MPVSTVLLLRHGHRLAWTLDPSTGIYTSRHPHPTALPADPPLASHGVRQAVETATYLHDLLVDDVRADRVRVYSSLFYRCLETLKPTVEALLHATTSDDVDGKGRVLKVRGERGLGEWFGKAWFEQPAPAPAKFLKQRYFPWLDDGYRSHVIPSPHGERIPELHDRVARVLSRVLRDVDAEFEAAGRGDEDVTVLVCGHAAPIVASGRALTGHMPDDPDTEDFKCFTAGLSQFVRRRGTTTTTAAAAAAADASLEDGENWRTNGGVAGGWECVANSDCGHLSQGEERGWHFHGDESFDSYGQSNDRGPITADGSIAEKL